jgi:hypothetical protein
MHFSDEPIPDPARGFSDALALLRSESLVALHSQPGLVSYDLATENGAPSYVEVMYLNTAMENWRLQVSVRTWANSRSTGAQFEKFDCFVEHYMSAYLTLHPTTPPDQYREPTTAGLRMQDVLVDGLPCPAQRLDDETDGLSGVLTIIDGRLVTCVWDSEFVNEPQFVVTARDPAQSE